MQHCECGLTYKFVIVISPARHLIFDFLCQIDSGRAFSGNILNSEIMKTIGVLDRHLITEVVYGTLRRQLYLDHILAGASNRSWRTIETGAKILLRMSLYQLCFMDRIPDHALVNDAVELAKKHLNGNKYRYLNGILRNLARTRPWKDASYLQEMPVWVRISLPKWLWKRWIKRYGKGTTLLFAESLNRNPSTTLRLGKQPELGKIPYALRPSDIVPGAFIRTEEKNRKNGYDPGPLPLQDEASQLIPHLLGDIHGSIIWDACAAPGGKTAILYDRVGLSGKIVATDIRMQRIQQLRRVLTDSPNLNILVADAGRPAPFQISFDAVMADVPCSGLGTLRKNPEIKWRFRPSEFLRLQKQQLSILEHVSENVRRGGKLLYSTCSTEPEENESVVESFLARHPDFYIERPRYPCGIRNWIGKDHMLRTFPSSRKWDGLFAVLMMRKS